MTKRIVYVVDDEEPIRRSLRLMLTVQGYAVTLFESGPALLGVVDALMPGCVLLDVRMPEMDGIEVQRHLAARPAELPVVVMTGHGDLTVAVSALQGGAVSFVEQPFTIAMLQQALAIAFLKLEDPDGYRGHAEAAAARVAALGAEERAVLAQLAAGRSNEAIAAELGIGAAAVEIRRARLLGALGAESLSDALRFAFAAGYGPAADLRDIT
jgi:two-component system response regulator FixJ